MHAAAGNAVRAPARSRILLMLAVTGIAAGLPDDATAQVAPAPNAFEFVDELVEGLAEDEPAAGESADPEPAEPGVSLPTDRGRERLLDRAQRLVADERWSDAVAMLDELLSHEHDAFVSAGASATQGSIRSETLSLLEQLPRPGRAAYELLFRGRAETRLAAAVAADDAAAIMAVARRWLHTPAGRQAALIAAIQALEHGRPADASAWLDRVARLPDTADLEPTLTLLRAVARQAGGDVSDAGQLLAAARGGRSDVRLAGRDLTLPPATDAAAAAAWLAEQVSGAAGQGPAAGEWPQFRGSASRAGLGDASRPFLVPRYRVPLVRHPEEARRLERLRQDAADQDRPLLPAGTPLAVGDKLVAHTPLGILAIDFESGRRIWLASAVAMAEADDDGAGGGLGRVFDDATSGNLASDGKLVFAVESPAGALADVREVPAGFGNPLGGGRDWEGGNTLTAYDLASGGVRWRLPERAGRQAPADAVEPTRPGGNEGRSRWHLGPPLVAGDDLFLLVEEDGEVLVEARSAASGMLRWWQPLASHDAEDAITSGSQTFRRRAGLTPALDDGVLVCPIGGGCVLGLDVATRSLLWSHAYPRPEETREPGPFGRIPDGREDEPARFGEPAPIIAGGRVILAPFDAETIICLNLRDGTPVWQLPRGELLAVAGVVDGRAVLVAGSRVEAIDLATGKRIWKRELDEGVHPSGRGVLTKTSLLLPCDTPGVLEVVVADGRIIGRSPARGGQIPGNLIAHRGEVISRGLNSLDVFHQEAALETRIETALKENPASPWAAYWQGSLAIEQGDLETGFDALARAMAAADFRLPPGAVPAAIERGMQRDFPVAARRWAELPGPATGRTSPGVLRAVVDGFLAAGDGGSAWPYLLQLLEDAGRGEPGGPFRDPADPRLTISEDRWLRGRLTRLLGLGDEPLQRAIDTALGRLIDEALATAEPAAAAVRLEWLMQTLGPHPAAERLRTTLTAAAGDADRRMAVRRRLLTLEATSDAASRSDRDLPAGDPIDPETAWPLGPVEQRELRNERRPQVIPLPLAGGGLGTRAARAAIDLTREQLLISDDLGRLVTSPLPVAGLQGGFGLPFINRTAALEVAVLGRVVFVRTSAGIAAYDLEGPPGAGRGLWQRPDLGTNPGDGTRWGGGVGGRVARDGAAPLGMRIDEPFDRPRGGGRGMVALPIGLVVPGSRSITVLDPGTGKVLWSRQLLPAGLEWLADDEFLCGCTVDGRGSLVFAAVDGSFHHRLDVPHQRQRVATRGRRLVGVTATDDLPVGGVARRVRLALVDPADQETRPLGEFDGRARATETSDGRLVVMEPDGRLTAFDLVDGGAAFSCRLENVPRAFERLHVQAWQDRYLVLAGGGDDDGGEISPLEQLLLSTGSAAPLSGAIWALDRADGRPLWPVPATVARHCLHIAQPDGLPVLAFCRLLEPRGRSREALSVLLLDKRTGHAVFEDDRIELQAQTGQCELTADPDTHTVTIGGFDANRGSLVLTFTGGPMAPRPPFQSRGGQPPLALAPAGER